MKKLVIYCCFILAFLYSCNKKEILFEQISSSESGVTFSNDLIEDPRFNIFTYLYFYNGAGVAAGDYNNDGLVDLYFVSNQQADKIYLNQGDFKFQDVSIQVGVSNDTGWTTGITNVDINGDGLLDIYICKVGGYQNLQGHNLLFVNQGNTSDGIPQFKEEAAKYGLDFSGFSTQAAFLDYDRDGDLDMFLLNHSVYPNRTYGRGSKRENFDPRAGDRLFKNNNGKYEDVSERAGIFQGEIGYGLGVGVSDLNGDGYPDIYVGNDFFENDYLYANRGDGTFDELIHQKPERLGHTTHFSMGNDIADINNDGLPDILSLDMLPQDLATYKTSGLEYPFQTYSTYLKNGFSPQFMQNTLHLNRGDFYFSETAFLSGVSATEWSWGALFADFDNDGHKDLVVSNGIKGATNDMDFIKYISNERIQERLSKGEVEDHKDLIEVLPEKKVRNYLYKNLGNNKFKDQTSEWSDFTPSFSHGLVYVDLDNDGDLDLVVNNMEEEAGIFRNLSENRKNGNSYLKVHLTGDAGNSVGIGARVQFWIDGRVQVQEHYLSRGYLSTVSPGLHFGTGSTVEVDSLQVVWPTGEIEVRKKIRTNSIVKFNLRDASKTKRKATEKPNLLLIKVDSVISHLHVEQATLDFNRDPLIPFAYSNYGPAISVGDFDGDGLEDLAIGGGKTQGLTLWRQTPEGGFEKEEPSIFETDAISENVGQVFSDIDGDGDLDLIVVSGGNEFRTGNPIQPKLYINDSGRFALDENQFKGVYVNASGVSAPDLNQDGFPDLCITANTVAGEYGKNPLQYLFLNDGKGNFTDVTERFSTTFKNLGNVQDVFWVDLDRNGFPDAIVAGHWMPLQIFMNDGEKLLLQKIEDNPGWWNVVEAGDFDGDGDIDFVAGNWGLNTRLTATQDHPIRLYLNDFNDNGSVDPVMTYFYEGVETPFASKDELDQQLPFLKKKFTTYKDFAKANFKDLFPKEKLQQARVKEAWELASCYFENLGRNRFKKHILPFDVQITSVFAIQKFDFNGDGYEDLLFLGNNHEISTQLGRQDASHGVLLINDRNGFFNTYSKNVPKISGPVRDIKQINIKGVTHFVIGVNNAEPVVVKSNF